MVKPISPQEVSLQKLQDMPARVIETWNRMIAKKYNGTSSVIIYQDDIVKELATANAVDRQTVFNEGWLDVEDFYRSVGWEVEYGKPVFNETYKAFFKFAKK